MKTSFPIPAEEYEEIVNDTKACRDEMFVFDELKAYVGNSLGRPIVITGETSREYNPAMGCPVVNVFFKEINEAN